MRIWGRWSSIAETFLPMPAALTAPDFWGQGLDPLWSPDSWLGGSLGRGGKLVYPLSSVDCSLCPRPRGPLL